MQHTTKKYRHNHLLHALLESSLNDLDKEFIFSARDSKSISYLEFFNSVEQLSAALIEAGIAPGDRIAAQVPKSVEALELYLASILAGAVFLPLNTAYTVEEVVYFLTDAEPLIFVCDSNRQDEMTAATKASGVRHLWTLSENGQGSLSEAKNDQKPGFEGITRSSTDLAAILYTSGTTGRSKGAMLSHAALVSNATTLCNYWHFGKQDRLIHALPIFHTHGLFVATNCVLMSSSSMIFLNRFEVDGIIKHMPDATVLMGVPTFYQRLLNHPDLSRASKSMRLFISGSAPLLEDTHLQWLENTGHAILERYGMTETNMNTSNPYSGERRAGTVGFALPGIRVIVADPQTGDSIPKGETGSIEVYGENLFSGYWRMPEKTAEEFRENGLFITGDLGRFDEDGYLHIVGRSKDLIISGGYNIYPKEIESLIDKIEGVAESAVIGVRHADLGEAVIAIVVVKSGQILNEATILAALSEKLARFKQPRRVEITDELPRNTMGKIQKNELRTRYNEILYS